MIKKKKYFCMLLAATLTGLLAACMDENDLPVGESRTDGISVSEAKAFFEEQMMRMGETGSSNELQGLATEFTPQWERAVTFRRDSMVSVDVPIITDFLFTATVWADDSSKTEKFTEDLLQKLIVVKNVRDGSMGTYIVSIVADKTYAESRRKLSAMDFPNYGNYGNFSGRIIYSLPLSSVPLRVNCFKDGRLTNAASLFELKDRPEEIPVVVDQMAELLSGIELKHTVRVGLRSSTIEYIDGGTLKEIVVTYNVSNGRTTVNYGYLLNLLYNESNSNDGDSPDPGYSGGNGGSSGSNSSGNSLGNSTTAPKKIAYSIDQFKNTGGYISGSCNCMCMSQKIMKQLLGNTAKIGSSVNIMQLWKDVNGTLTKVGNANDVFNTLNDHINANRPIITGVNHRDGHPGNSDKTTDHFIVITGRGYDAAKGQYYYNYVETGRTVDNGAGATSDSNRLYYDSSVGTFKTEDKAAQGGKTYTITQIRPNNN